MTTSIKILFLTLSLYTLQTLYTLSAHAQLVSDFRVNDDTTNTEQYEAKIGVDSFGNFVVVWTDFRKEGSEGVNVNVYCQRFSPNGGFTGNNFRINESVGSSSSPAIVVRKDGSFLVCWKDFSIRYRLFNSIGIPYGSSSIINDSIVNRGFNPPSVGADSNGNFVVCWQEYKFGQSGNIYFQKLDSLGNKIGNNMKVNDDTGNNQHKNPSIAVRQEGSFIITWQDSRPPSIENSEDIYMQIYSKSGVPIGNNVRVSDDNVLFNKQHDPKISSDTSGRFCISFSNFNLNEVQTDVEYQLYNPDGSRSGNNFKIAGSIIDEFNAAIFKKMNGDMVSGFNYYGGSRFEPYFQRIINSGILFGTRHIVSSELTFADKYYSDLVVWNDRIISIWSDVRNGNLDIYCNIRSYINPDSTTSIKNISVEIPEGFNLFQNYPNPFNSHTNIVFAINVKNDYALEIYNTLGMTVDRLDYKDLNPGTYKISYDASALSSGIYYYSMNSGSMNSVRKFVFLK